MEQDREIRNLIFMLKRWKKEGDRFRDHINLSGYEPDLNQSHIWANLYAVLDDLDYALEGWAD